jgi:uncharacterized membrane protein
MEMESLLFYIYDACLAVYFGSSIFMGFIAAPNIFKTLKTRNEAGNLVGLLLEKFAALTYVLQIILIISGAGLLHYFNYSPLIIVLPFLIVIINIISGQIISRKMKKLKEIMGNIDNTPKDDKNRIMFNSLHKWSVRLFVLNQLLALPLFYFISR